MATRKNTRPKAARLHLTAVEAVLSAAKAEAAGNLQAAHDAMQRAVVATKESLALKHPWTELEQGELDTILRGGATTESEVPLGEVFCGPSPAEAHERSRDARGWLIATVGTIDSRSGSGRERAAERPQAKFNRRVEMALAEATLPTKPGERVRAAVAHLKANHLDLWNETAPGASWPVRRSTKTGWFRERMRLSEELRDDRLRTAAAEMPTTDADSV